MLTVSPVRRRLTGVASLLSFFLFSSSVILMALSSRDFPASWRCRIFAFFAVDQSLCSAMRVISIVLRTLPSRSLLMACAWKKCRYFTRALLCAGSRNVDSLFARYASLDRLNCTCLPDLCEMIHYLHLL